MGFAYRIKDWSDNYENNKSKQWKHCSFVCVPNKQHGLGFCHIMSEPDGAAIYGIWHLILGACSQQENRDGWLTTNGYPAAGVPRGHYTDIDNIPHGDYGGSGGVAYGDNADTAWTSGDLAVKFRRPVNEVDRAIEVLCSERVGWIEKFTITGDNHTASGCCENAENGQSQDGTREGAAQSLRTEKNRKEQKRSNNILRVFEDECFLKALKDWDEHFQFHKWRSSPPTLKLQAAQLLEWGVQRATAALVWSAKNGQKAIYEEKKSANQKSITPTEYEYATND